MRHRAAGKAGAGTAGDDRHAGRVAHPQHTRHLVAGARQGHGQRQRTESSQAVTVVGPEFLRFAQQAIGRQFAGEVPEQAVAITHRGSMPGTPLSREIPDPRGRIQAALRSTSQVSRSSAPPMCSPLMKIWGTRVLPAMARSVLSE